MRFALPWAFAAVGALAAEASGNTVCSSSLTVASQSDLDGLAGCPLFVGNIVIDGPLTSANIPGIQMLQGSLIVKNITDLTSITAPDLVNITGALTLEILQSLSVVSFPKLKSAGDITFVTLTSLDTFQLDSGITSAKSLIISDTTIKSIAGISLETVDTLNINNNKFLTTLDFNLQSVSNILELSSTASNVEVSFPYLQWANNVTLRDIVSVSLPNVTAINSTLSFTNSSLQEISCPFLKTIGGSLAIVSNNQLTNTSFPSLTTISGGFQVANNSHLAAIEGFPVLQKIGGAIDVVGAFDNVTIPMINDVSGGVLIDSSSEQFNCSDWNNFQKMGGVHGDSYKCKALSSSTSVAITANSATKTGSRSATGTGSASSSSSSGGAYHVDVSSASTLGALAALIFQFL